MKMETESMVGGSNMFNKSLNIEVSSCVSHHVIESFGVIFLSCTWFFILCTVSYLINDLIPAYKKSETLGKTWAWLLVELCLTVLAFHQVVRLMQHVSETLFSAHKEIRTLPEVHGSILSAFALIIFQSSLAQRAKKVWISFMGVTNVAES